MSTVGDAGDGELVAGRSRENVYCSRRRWRELVAGRSRENVHCSRRRWRGAGSGSQQGECLLWSTPVTGSW
jgi:hypothetical protein